MPMNRRNAQILERIIRYCDDIHNLSERFGKTYEAYTNDFAYLHASAMCILQIGELVSNLT